MKVLSAVAWPYANGPRHLGHVAGFGVPSDVFSRFMRMAGHDVLMVSGSDEHGTPILVLADQAGVSPREFVDTNHAVIASELSLIPGVKPFQLYAPGDTPYASMSPGTAGVGTKYTAEFDQVRLRFNAVYGDVTLPFDTLFTAENTNRNTSDDNPCRSGRPT